MISIFFFFNDTATTEIYTLSLHDALPICASPRFLSGHTFFTLRLPNPGVVLATSHIRSKIRKETVMKKTISLSSPQFIEHITALEECAVVSSNRHTSPTACVTRYTSHYSLYVVSPSTSLGEDYVPLLSSLQYH